MGKYSSYSRPKPVRPRNVGVHPVMRGIGCIMMVVVPILSYGIAALLVNYGATHGWPIPAEWFGPLSVHPVLMKVRGLQPIFAWLQNFNNLEANLAFAIVVVIVIGGLMAILYDYVYSLFGPPKYEPQDAPPSRVKVKRYKR